MSLLPIRRAPGMVGSSVALGLSALVFPWSSQARACLACRKLMHCDCSTIRKRTISCRQTVLLRGRKEKGEIKKKNLRSLFGFFFFFSMNWVRCIRHSPLNGGGGGRSDSLACLQLGPRIQRSGIATSRMTLQTSARGTYGRGPGPYQVEVEVRACPLRQLQKTHGGVGVLPYLPPE